MPALTLAQEETLRQFVYNDPVYGLLDYSWYQPEADCWTLKAWLAEPSTQTVWKNLLQLATIMQNGFDWTQVDNLTIGKARIWEWLWWVEGGINPSKPNVRAAIEECWKGTAAMLAVRASVLEHCKRIATRFEAIFLVGTGTNAIPVNLVIDSQKGLAFGEVREIFRQWVPRPV